MQKCFISLVLKVLITFAAVPVLAKDHPYNADFEKQVRQLFFEGDTVSRPKVDRYVKRLQMKRAELHQLVQQQEMRLNQRSSGEAFNEADEHKFIVLLDRAIEHLNVLPASRSQSAIMSEAKMILDMEAAIRFEGLSSGIPSLVEQAKNIFVRWQAHKNAPAAAQASNLYYQGAYLSPTDIQTYVKNGGDLSLLDPGPESTFWEKPADISQVDVRKAARGKTLKFYQDVTTKFPDENVFYYEEVKASDTKPKIDVYARDDKGKKLKFKLKFGAEINSDPTVSALTMTLGYPTDVVKNIRNIRMILGKKTTLSDVKRDWESYYRRDNVKRNNKIEKFISESGVDAEGNHYVVFKEALIEAKPKQVTRLGGWRFGDLSHTSLRELRGLTIIQMWMANIDMKEFANNRLLVTDNSRAHIIADLGGSLGGLFLEQPELFPATMVAGNSKQAVTLRYRSFQSNSIKNHITYEDARWATKQIAALTRSQITEAVNIGQWPTCVAGIYVEKLISRRNDLVKAFKLEGVKQENGQSIALMPVDLSPQTINYDMACSDVVLERDFTSNYDFDLGFLLKPAGVGILRGLLNTARGTLNDTRHITIDHMEIGLDAGTIAQVILNVSRTFEKNPHPKTEQDLFIFQEHFEIGLRLGASYGIFKDATYIRKFTMSYPMRTIEEGRLKDHFIANILLPLDIANGNLPEKYVLMTEHYLEHGIGTELDDMGAMVSPTLRAKYARALLFRSFLDHRDPEQYVLFRDRARYDEVSLELFARVSLLKLPLFKTLHQWGKTKGVGARLSNKLAHSPKLSQEIKRAMLDGDFSGLKDTEERFRIDTTFRANSRAWDLLFWRGSESSRLDRLSVSQQDRDPVESLQYRTQRNHARSFFWKETEERDVSVEVYAAPNGGKEKLQVDLAVSHHDTRTTDKEMEQSYLFFINGISANGLPLIPLTVGYGYSTNGRWGDTIVQTRTSYYQDGLERLLTLKQDEYFDELNRVESAMPSLSQKESTTLRSKAQLVWRMIAQAQKESASAQKLRAIAKIFSKAIYRQRGFYEARLIGVLNRLVGRDHLFTSAEVRAPDFVEQNFLNDAPMFGHQGEERETDRDFVLYVPTTPMELYTMFNFLRTKTAN